MSTNYYLRTTLNGVVVGDLHLCKYTASKMLFQAVRDKDEQVTLGSTRQLHKLLDEVHTTEHMVVIDEYGRVIEVDDFRELIRTSKCVERPTEYLHGISPYRQWIDDDNYIWCDYEFC